MAPEAPTPDPEKVRRSRSFGSFLLFLFVLIVVVAYVGSSSISGKDQLSQDEYLWYLNTGQIESQKFEGSESGTNRIVGTYRAEDDKARLRHFQTSFADAGLREEELRELKAIHVGHTLPWATLADAVTGGWYEPLHVRRLTRYRNPAAPEPTRSAFPLGARPRTEPAAETAPVEPLETRLFVEVGARTLESWYAAHGIDSSEGATSEDELAAATPPFPLPDRPLDQWVEVELGERDDLSAIVASLETGGARVTRNQFDVTPTQGTSFAESSNLLSTVLLVYGPWILIFAVFLIVMRQMRSQGGAGGVMSFGRSRAQLYSKENRTNITFDDVAGANEAKAEVREIVEFLKNPGRFTRIGGRIPRGVLLVGPPGCGKTLLAKAIAGEAEVPFFSISGSDFVEMFVGVGASRVRDLFKQARDNSPCIIFLDEIDAVGRRRGSGMGGGHDEREQTLNAILVEMDGFGTDEGIIVVAATNRPDVLDPALLRPGRFDREVTIELPDMEGRESILSVHLKRVRTGSDVDARTLARSTPGYSGADLAAIVNEAAIMAVLAKREEILMEDLEEARDKVRYGRQKISRKIELEDRKITAYHEAGHAVVAASLPKVDKPHKITIVPRGRALGATMVLPSKESHHMQKERLEGQLATLFGGRVAEAEFCGDISAGASDDIRRATDLARAMVTELGMSERIGPINYAERQGSDFLGTELMRGKSHSEETAHAIDEEVHRLVSEAYAKAESILREHRGATEELAEALLLYETVNGDEVTKLMEGVKAPDLRPERPDPPGTPRRSEPSVTPEPSAPESDDRIGELPGNPGLSPA